jgi:hypothetical protein
MGSYLLVIIITIVVSLVWGYLIIKAHDEAPEYKGNDFLDWDKEEEEKNK